MTLTGKAVAGVATTGLLGGAGVGSYYAFGNFETISGRLTKEKFELLDTSKTNNDWTTVFTAYQKATKNTFTGAKDTSLDEAGLRRKCEGILKKTPDDSNYKLAKQWCVKEKAVSKILDDLNLRFLDTTSDSSNTIKDKAHWNSKVAQYERSQATNKITVNLTGNDDAKATAMRDACKTLNTPELKTTTDGFIEKLEQIQKWCAIGKDIK
ncbi:hypothetical protein A6V39_03845 [Candidatus Mycoplasma haematobovis]|uniref:Uncharacterized protein n=1 Tax=Candidatus Mycoplasma haematobovis TaxID=432608 RepID=A0A1A9QEA5_9MOLU|nr:hypothetical protein [Candidatus Mycoplasma haematobovis]OAL10020.1 hypothetical protein A6V39_03845 [Candidatus Mycoplasma haematobovis]